MREDFAASSLEFFLANSVTTFVFSSSIFASFSLLSFRVSLVFLETSSATFMGDLNLPLVENLVIGNIPESFMDTLDDDDSIFNVNYKNASLAAGATIKIVPPRLRAIQTNYVDLFLYVDKGIYKYLPGTFISVTGIKFDQTLNYEQFDTDRGILPGIPYEINNVETYLSTDLIEIIKINVTKKQGQGGVPDANWGQGINNTIPDVFENAIISIIPKGNVSYNKRVVVEQHTIDIKDKSFNIEFNKTGIYTLKFSNHPGLKTISVVEGCTLNPTNFPTSYPSGKPTISPTDSPVASTFPPTYTLIVESSETAISTNVIALMATMAILMVMMVAVMCSCYRKSSKKPDKRGRYRKV